jgi:Tfp pilus assembly protein PilO
VKLVIREKDKQIVLLAFFIAFIVIDVAMLLGWQCRLFSKYSQTLSKKKQIMVNLDNDIMNFNKTKKEAGDLDEKAGVLRISIMDEKNISALIENISNLANSSGVKITQIKPVMDISDSQIIEAKDNKFKEVEIQIVGKSSFHQLGNFISQIEKDKTFFKISSLDIEADAKDFKAQNVRLSLKTFVNVI